MLRAVREAQKHPQNSFIASFAHQTQPIKGRRSLTQTSNLIIQLKQCLTFFHFFYPNFHISSVLWIRQVVTLISGQTYSVIEGLTYE